MTTAGPNLAGSGTNDATVGTTNWTNPGNITADDGVNAHAPQLAVSNYLLATGFGFSISGTVTQISVDIDISLTTLAVENSIRLFLGGVPIEAEKSTGASLSAGVKTYTWSGLSLSGTDVSSSSFGIGFSVDQTGDPMADLVVDYISMTATYSALPDAVGTMGNPSGAWWLFFGRNG